MSDDIECRKSYKEALKVIRDYLESQCKDGESLEAEVYGHNGIGCYVRIEYATIVNRKHINESEHLPIGFLSEQYVLAAIPVILDGLLKHWREKAGV